MRLKIAQKYLQRYVLMCLPSVKYVQELSRPGPVAAAKARQSVSFLFDGPVVSEQKPQDAVLQPA